MKIPKDVSSNSVQTHSFHHLQTMMPIWGWHTRIMHLTRMNLDRLSVIHKITAFYLKLMLGLCRS